MTTALPEWAQPIAAAAHGAAPRTINVVCLAENTGETWLHGTYATERAAAGQATRAINDTTRAYLVYADQHGWLHVFTGSRRSGGCHLGTARHN